MYDELMSKMARYEFCYTHDRLFSVGDLVDRGPESLKCLQLINEPWFHSVKGNHEDMLIDVVLKGGDVDHYYFSGGEWLAEIDGAAPEFIELVEKANALPLVLSIETNSSRVWVSHATPRKNWNDDNISAEEEVDLLWSRREISQMEIGICESVDTSVISYHGHTVVDKHTCYPTHPNTHWIDTGAVYGYELTFLQL